MTGKHVTSVSDSLQTWGLILICLISPNQSMGYGNVETIPRSSILLMHLLFFFFFPPRPPEGENNQILTLVIQGKLAPVYINMLEMKKEKKTEKKRDKLFIQHKY